MVRSSSVQGTLCSLAPQQAARVRVQSFSTGRPLDEDGLFLCEERMLPVRRSPVNI
jgi:hypothetical protein